MGEHHERDGGARQPAERAPVEAGRRPSGTIRRAEAQDEASRRESRPIARQPRSPSPSDVLAAVVRLSRRLSVQMEEDDIVHAYLAELEALFPARRIAIRVLDRKGRQLRVAAANGRLLPERRGRLAISRRAFELYEAPCPSCIEALPLVDVTEAYRPIFVDGEEGFEVPLFDGERLLGLLSVEYPVPLRPPPDEPAVMGSLAVQLAATLRNARLAREALYLRDYLGRLIDRANVPIVMLGRHRGIRVVNRALLSLARRDQEEVLGRDFMELLPDSERQRLLPVFVSALRGRSVHSFELNLPRKGGGVVRLSLDISSVLGADGEVEGVIAIGRDLAEVRQLEEQVIQAEKLATLGQLAAGVVHELNNPLTGITVYGEFLLRKAEREGRDPAEVEKLRRIVEAAERILRFTRDLVTYARPSSGEPQRLSVHEVLDQSVVFCEHVLRSAGVEVARDYAAALPPIAGVRDQLGQVFVNLVTNACHAMPGGGTLTLRTDEPEPGVVRVQVRDEGEGIAPEHLERIFEPFFTTKSRDRGTGLGLSIVRNIVVQHGGEIEVHSQPGQGTTFELRFPAATAPDTEAAQGR